MYSIGQNRLFFQSNTLTGEPVEIEIINPRLEKSKRFRMIYVDEGLYYFDADFKYHGSHAMKVFQNGNKVGHSILTVGNANGIITKKY